MGQRALLAGASMLLATTWGLDAWAQSDAPTCVPDCRTGYVCVEGRCVSACNPPCAEHEVCTDDAECVERAPAPAATSTTGTAIPARATAPSPSPPAPADAPTATTPSPPAAAEPAAAPRPQPAPGPADQVAPASTDTATTPYGRSRLGLGGGVGLGVAPDGTGFPFSFLAAYAFPLSATWYGRADVFASYFTTSADDTYALGGGDFADTYIDSEHVMLGLRLAAGVMFSDLVGVRFGPLLGYRTTYVEHGLCGSEYQEDDFGGAAFGGTGALAFHTETAEFSAAVDAYSGQTQGSCKLSADGFSGELEGHQKFALQLILQGTYLF